MKTNTNSSSHRSLSDPPPCCPQEDSRQSACQHTQTRSKQRWIDTQAYESSFAESGSTRYFWQCVSTMMFAVNINTRCIQPCTRTFGAHSHQLFSTSKAAFDANFGLRFFREISTMNQSHVRSHNESLRGGRRFIVKDCFCSDTEHNWDYGQG